MHGPVDGQGADRSRRADGFQLASGLVAISAGPVLALRGAPAGWSLLLIAAGIVIVAVQCVIVGDVEFEIPDRTVMLVGFVGLVSVGIAVVYLTRAADDLPAIFPGHDGGSERFRILPGALMMLIGAVGLFRAMASVRLANARS